MSQTPTDEPQWQQPAWESSGADSIADPPPAEPSLEPLTGTVLVPAKASAPSALESVLTVVVSVVWPVAIVAVFLGFGNWWWNIGAAIVLSSLIGAVNGELAKRRRAR